MTRVRAVELRLVGLPLVRPFRTSFGTSTEKVCVLARVETEDAEGWGECVADIEPGFSEEFNEGAWLVLRDFLVPALLRAGDVTREELGEVFAFVRGNPMAKARWSTRCSTPSCAPRRSLAALWAGCPAASRAACRWASPPPSTSCSPRSTATSRRATGGSS